MRVIWGVILDLLEAIGIDADEHDRAPVDEQKHEIWGKISHRKMLLAHRGANGVAMPKDEDDQDGHFFYNHPEGGGLLRRLQGGSEFRAVPAATVRSPQHRVQSTQGLISRSIRSISSLVYRHPPYFGV